MRNPSGAGKGPGGGTIALAYGLLALLVFSRCLFLPRAYFDSDLLAQFAPWRDFLKAELAQGRFPLWDPYLLGGQPFLADLQNMMLYPPNYLTLPFAVPLGLSLFIALHWTWAALGMRYWLRVTGLGEAAAGVGALAFALSGFFWMELIHPPVLAAFAWMPWWFAGLERLARDPQPRAAFLAGLAFALLGLGGSFQVGLGAFYAGAAYLALRAFQEGRFTPQSLAKAALFLGLGALPLLSQLIPTFEFASLSNRSTPADYLTFNASFSMDPASLFHAWFPTLDLPPTTTLDQAVQAQEHQFLSVELYLGPWVFFLAALAFRTPGPRGPALFFLAAALTTLALCVGSAFPLHRWVTLLLPGFSHLRGPFRFSYFWAFSLATLAAWGFESLREKKFPPAWLQAGGLYALALLLAALIHPARASWEILGLGLGLAALPLLGSKRRDWGLGLFALALLLPLLARGWGLFSPAPLANFDYPKNSAALISLTAPQMPARVFIDPENVPYPVRVRHTLYVSYYPENAFAALRIKDFGGYNPLSLSAVNNLRFLPPQTIFKLMAVKGFATSHDLKSLPGFRQTRADSLFFYQSLFSGAEAYAPRFFQVLPEAKSRLARMGSPDFDPYREGILDAPLPEGLGRRLSGQDAALSYQWLRDEPTAQSFRLSTARDSLVVFAEVDYPGWKAALDGKPTDLFMADHVLRAVFVPAGTHQVDFKYQPWWAPCLPLPWLFCLLGGLWLWRRKGH
ncbi:MAG TPA: hypothetical protein VMU88_03870 [bacterium]|nr:hypothetical protein [bacterium]